MTGSTRPPNYPPTPPPPNPPPPAPPTDDLMALADAAFETPARRDHEARYLSSAVATTGGPVKPAFTLPNVRVPLAFDPVSGELVATNPPPPPPKPFPDPQPYPPPEIGAGPLYDALPCCDQHLAAGGSQIA